MAPTLPSRSSLQQFLKYFSGEHIAVTKPGPECVSNPLRLIFFLLLNCSQKRPLAFADLSSDHALCKLSPKHPFKIAQNELTEYKHFSHLHNYAKPCLCLWLLHFCQFVFPLFVRLHPGGWSGSHGRVFLTSGPRRSETQTF